MIGPLKCIEQDSVSRLNETMIVAGIKHRDQHAFKL